MHHLIHSNPWDFAPDLFLTYVTYKWFSERYRFRITRKYFETFGSLPDEDMGPGEMRKMISEYEDEKAQRKRKV